MNGNWKWVAGVLLAIVLTLAGNRYLNDESVQAKTDDKQSADIKDLQGALTNILITSARIESEQKNQSANILELKGLVEKSLRTR